jgi:alpha-beta hydrolase superfamily lysophospholipase
MATCVALMPPAQSKVVETDDPQMLGALRIPTYVWRDDLNSKPSAIILGLHSGCAHGKSFNTLATQLAERNVMFVSFDMRGYGKWYHDKYGTEADRTFDYARTIEDIKSLLSTLHKEFPGTPIYCMGESLGANMAMVVAHDMPAQTNGVILVSPYFVARKWLSPRFLGSAAHIMTHSGEIDMSAYLKKKLAYDDAIGEQLVSDPESRNEQSVKELGKSMRLNWSGRKKIREIATNMPVLVLHGKEDELCSPSGTAHAFGQIPSSKKQLVLINGVGHIIAESSQINPQFFTALTKWIDQAAVP